MTESPNFRDELPEELLPDEFERSLLAYQFIVHETPFQERLDFLYSLIEKASETDGAADEVEAVDEEYDRLTDDVLADFRERAQLGRFDFMPEENEELTHIKHRLEIQAMIASLEAADDEERKEEFDFLEMNAHEIMKQVAADFAAGLEFADGFLIAREDLFIAHYFPELLDEIREEAGKGDH